MKPIGKDKLIAEMGARIAELENVIERMKSEPRDRRQSARSRGRS